MEIRYRGRLVDPARLEDFEDRLVDVGFDLGGKARIWRSASKTKPDRLAGGVLLELAPGLDPVSFLVSPEGWLVPALAIEDAEEGRLSEAPWVSVETRFASVEAHVVLVEILDALQSQGFLELEVDDQGGYRGTRSLETLVRNRDLVAPADVTLCADAAAEDPEVLATRIEQLTERVHRTLRRAPEHPTARIGEDVPEWLDPCSQGTEEEWDALYREQERKKDRLERAIDEGLVRGLDRVEALEEAIESVIGPDLPDPEQPDEVPWEDALPSGEAEDQSEPWRESLHASDLGARHALQERAMALTIEVMRLNREHDAAIGSLVSALLEVGGGLAQALGDDVEVGLRLVQLKRSLRGAAFGRGALVAARGNGLLDEERFAVLLAELVAIQSEVLEETRRVRALLRD